MSNSSAVVSKLSRRRKMRLGELLLEAGAITQDQLDQALALQKRSGQKLGRALTEVGAIDEAELYRFLAKRLDIEYLDLSSIKLQTETVMLLPEVQARRLRALVLKRDRDGLLIGMADPTDIFAHDELSRLLGKSVKIALVNETELLRTIDIMYRRTDEIDALAAEVKEDLGESRIDIDELNAEEDSAEAPVIKLLQSMFRDAVQVSASDIHIEPDEFVLRIRQRVDGVLQEHVIDGRGVAGALVTRLKLMSGLDISEKRLPQDGRFSVRVNETTLDIRVSTLPVQFGEAIVLRLLDHSANLLSLEKLGMPERVLERFYRMIERPSGMVLVTGPTGSGKTTTLYSALNYVNKPATKIITVEDPVEYRLERINQVQVHARIGLDFGRVLRTALRQDPDIILVGEMRDRETVDIGLRAAMTGHLVFSTLHTVSAVATANRLLDMGAPGYLIGAALQGIVAQRLVRRVCESCAEPLELTPGQKAWLAAQVGAERAAQTQFQQGRGCNYCQLTGYRGRIGVYELLEMDAGLTDALRREDLSEFIALAGRKRSYVPLVNCALDYAAAGVTSLEEVVRVAGGLDIDDESYADAVAPTTSGAADG
ncbi:MAG: GspE/PulE family protein [Gammaproteobacteria bacterium]|nr:GspE/PulE family protein [Gammaproteobacteria bacterium]